MAETEKKPEPQREVRKARSSKMYGDGPRIEDKDVKAPVKKGGAPEPAGTTSKGLTIRTRPDAQVVAPYDGQVVFAGLFRGYGQILIIEHSEGYHTLLSGLSRIDAVPGQWILAGEPVGVMGSREGSAPELYVELRRNGRPINPLPWLALHNGKVSG